MRATAEASLTGLLLAVFGVACGESSAELSPLAQQGHEAYRSICITCHNGVPSQDGAVGPAIAGSSRELIEAKVLRGEYPPGYTPKRDTHAMPRFEYMADQIDALTAYLAEAKP
jgi:mono/diheme cytochrome c family protein